MAITVIPCRGLVFTAYETVPCLTQAPIFVWFDGTIIVYVTTLLNMYYSVS